MKKYCFTVFAAKKKYLGMLAALCLVSPFAVAETVASEKIQDSLHDQPSTIRFVFDSPSALEGWSIGEGVNATIGKAPDGTPALSIVRDMQDGVGSAMIRIPISLDAVRGGLLSAEGTLWSEDVPKPPQPWNGIKFMISSFAKDYARYSQKQDLWGNFGWKKVRFGTPIHKDATKAELTLGIEEGTGKVWFRDLTITVIARESERPAVKADGPIPKVHDEERLRGFMIDSRRSEEALKADLEQLAKWKVNLIRWQLIWRGFPRTPADTADIATYTAWLDASLAKLDHLLPLCAELGIRVVLDLHTLPGGIDENSIHRVFTEKDWQQAFVSIWANIATRYKDNRSLWAYDIFNEPNDGWVAPGLLGWNGLAAKTAQLIRSIDPAKPIIIESDQGGSPAGFAYLKPTNVSDVIYSVHFYEPLDFTHQGVQGRPMSGWTYPGVINGTYWNKAKLKEAMRYVINFQEDYKVPIYVGEFSTIRWAPGDSAANYLRDAIEIFEEQGWDWSYHAFREWHGWSVEHGPDPADEKPVSTPTDRALMLIHGFDKNEVIPTR